MPPSIGTTEFVVMTGSPVPSGTAIEMFARPGEDYSQRRQIGLREKQAVLETILFSDSADDEVSAQTALQGTLADIVDDHGSSFAGCLIVDVQPEKKAVIHNGSATVMIRTRWVVQWEA